MNRYGYRYGYRYEYEYGYGPHHDHLRTRAEHLGIDGVGIPRIGIHLLDGVS